VRTKFCGEYLDVRGRRQQEVRENKKNRKYIIFIPFKKLIRMRKSTTVRWTGYVAHMIEGGGRRNVFA
jgi:hypothetical protein